MGVRKDFTALEKIVLALADDAGRIFLSRCAPMEVEVYLWVLIGLEAKGFVRREAGNIPLLPFALTPMGSIVRFTLLHW